MAVLLRSSAPDMDQNGTPALPALANDLAGGVQASDAVDGAAALPKSEIG